jgi:hypothetical protein
VISQNRAEAAQPVVVACIRDHAGEQRADGVAEIAPEPVHADRGGTPRVRDIANRREQPPTISPLRPILSERAPVTGCDSPHTPG